MKNKAAKIDLKLKCGACGGKGHMRTNKACPKFVPDEFDESLNTSFTEREVSTSTCDQIITVSYYKGDPGSAHTAVF